jgi:AraC-like DNA-binding protein
MLSPMDREDFFRYLTYSEADEKWQIVCTDVGKTSISPHGQYPSNRLRHPIPFRNAATGRVLNEFQIVYITEGRGTFWTRKERYPVVPGTVFILFPGEFHRYHPDPDVGWVEWWVGFRGPHAERLRDEGIISPGRPLLEVGLKSECLSLFVLIFEAVLKQDPAYQARAGAGILMLIAEIHGLLQKSRLPDRYGTIVEEAKFAMEEKINGSIDLGWLSRKVGISVSRLATTFKAYTGMTPYQYFIMIKMNKAKELLNGKEVCIKQVAFDLGFDNQFYFSRLFKKKTGISPSRWSTAK